MTAKLEDIARVAIGGHLGPIRTVEISSSDVVLTASSEADPELLSQSVRPDPVKEPN